MGTLRAMGAEGDTRLIWDPEKDAEVAAARTMFDQLRAKGYLAYQVKRNGEQGKIVSTFDPDAEKLILAPPMAGG